MQQLFIESLELCFALDDMQKTANDLTLTKNGVGVIYGLPKKEHRQDLLYHNVVVLQNINFTFIFKNY